MLICVNRTLGSRRRDRSLALERAARALGYHLATYQADTAPARVKCDVAGPPAFSIGGCTKASGLTCGAAVPAASLSIRRPYARIVVVASPQLWPFLIDPADIRLHPRRRRGVRRGGDLFPN